MDVKTLKCLQCKLYMYFDMWVHVSACMRVWETEGERGREREQFAGKK